MSGLKKFFLGLLSVIMILSLTLGLTFGVRKNTNEKNELQNTNQQYAQAIEELQTEVRLTVENVSKLEYQIELNGLTIDDLTKTIVVYEKEIVELENTIVEKEVEIVEKNNTIVGKQVEIQTLTNTITEKEQEIVEIEKTVVEYEEKIVYLESEAEVDTAEIERLQAEIDSLNSQIADKNAEIEDLNNQIADKNATIVDLEAQIETLTAEKETAEVRIVEKETIITEKEEIIVEKETEIETLVAEVDVLNTTIVELNVQINLLEESLENNTGFYFDLLSTNVDLCKISDESYLLSSDEYAGVYLVNSNTYDYVHLYSDKYYWDTFVRLNDGNYIITSSLFEVGTLYFNVETNKCSLIHETSLNSISAIGSNDALLSNVSEISGYNGGHEYMYFFDGDTMDLSVIVEDTWVNHSLVLSNGDAVLFRISNHASPMYYFDYETKSIEIIFNSDESMYIGYVVEIDGFLFVSGVSQSSSNLGLWFVDIDNEDKELQLLNADLCQVSNFYSCENYILFSCEWNVSAGLYSFDKQTYEITPIYETVDCWNVYLELSSGKVVFASDDLNGRYGLLVYNPLDNTVSHIGINNNFAILFEAGDGNVLALPDGNNYYSYEQISVVDIESGEYNSYSISYYYDTFVKDDMGVTITCSSNKNASALYYSYETGAITEITE